MATMVVVEDNVQLCRLYARILDHHGVNVGYAHSCKEAYEYLQEVVPQLVLLDMNLPDGTGLDLIAWIQSQPHLVNVPIVIVSSDNHRKNPIIRDLVTDCVVKPLSNQGLVELVHRFVKAA